MKAKHIVGAAAALAAAALYGQAASAKDGVWRVGGAYVVRHTDLDLSTLEGRRQLLDMVETAARRACRGEATRGQRFACEADAREQALASADAAARAAVTEAQREREERAWAAR